MTPAELRILRNTWSRMIDRCENTNHARTHRYLGRGIRVCDEWRNNFEAFAVYMGPRPPGASIDRIDNDKGYERGNCRWADTKTQIRNSATAKMTETDVRELLRLVHEEGHAVHALDLIFPLSVNQIRSIALGKHYRLEDFIYPTTLPRKTNYKKYREGRHPKLTPDGVRDIRKRYAEGQHVNEIAALYGVSSSNAYNVARRHTWRHVD